MTQDDMQKLIYLLQEELRDEQARYEALRREYKLLWEELQRRYESKVPSDTRG